MTDFSTPRINASMMPSYQGRNVCIVGMAKDIDSNGTSFTLTTSDDKNIRVVMQEPLNEYLAGLTEVHGTIDDRNSIQCQNYISYKPEMSEAFDMSLYNTAVELMARAPQFYIQGVQQG